MSRAHKFYQRILLLSRHRHAGFYLFALSFLESFILPISPAVLQVPLTLARPRYAWRYVCYAFIGSCLGGAIGYGIGMLIGHYVFPYFMHTHYYHEFLDIKDWVAKYGPWILFPVSVSPIPYKVTTIASGILAIPFGLFFLVTLPGRFIHFAVFAYLMSHPKMGRFKRFLMRRYSKFKVKK